MHPDGWVFCWVGPDDDGTLAIKARRFSAPAVAALEVGGGGGVLQVSDGGLGKQRNPTCRALPHGRTIVVWEGQSGGLDYDIRARVIEW